MDPRPRQSLNWTKTLGWLLSLAALFFVGRWLWRVDPAVWKYLRSTNLSSLVVSLIIFQGWFLLRYLGWEWISQRYGLSDARASNVRMWTLSELMRYIPGNVWSFAARYKGARQRGTTRGGAVAALVLEALFLTSGAALVAALFWKANWWLVWFVAAAAAIWLIPWVMKKIALWRHWDNVPGPSVSGAMLLLTIYTTVWLLYGLAQTIMIKSIPGLNLPSFGLLMGVNVAAWLIGYISIVTPMGLGVREVAFVSLLKSTSSSVASLLAVATRVWLIVAEIVFLSLVMPFSRRR